MGDDLLSPDDLVRERVLLSALGVWARTGDIDRVAGALGVDRRSAAVTLRQAQAWWRKHHMRDAEAVLERQAAQLEGLAQLVLDQAHRAAEEERERAVLDASGEFRNLLAEQRKVLGIPPPTPVRPDKGGDGKPVFIHIGAGATQTAEEAVALAPPGSGPVVVVDTRRPWEIPEVIDGEATDDGEVDSLEEE